MRKKTKQIVPLSSAAAIWRPSSAQSVTPDVWPKNRKHEPTVRLEEQGREVARSTSLPYAMEDLCLQAGSNKTNVCLYSRNDRFLALGSNKIFLSSVVLKKMLQVSLWTQLDDMRRNTMSMYCLQGLPKVLLLSQQMTKKDHLYPDASVT